MKQFELLYIIPARVAQEQIPDVITSVQKIIHGAQGVIVKEENLGNKKLAYPIKQQNHGTYVYVEFDVDAQAAKDVDRSLRLHNDILRYLITSRYVKTPDQLRTEEAAKVRMAAHRKKAEQEKQEAAQKEVASSEENAKEDAKLKKEKIEKKTKAGDLLKAHGVSDSEKVEAPKQPELDDSKKSLEELDKELDKIMDDNML